MKCRLRHRWSRWSMVRIECRGGGSVSVVPYDLFRMCCRCGFEQRWDLRPDPTARMTASALTRWRARMP